MVKAKIIGAGGYGGVGLCELLLGHPEAEIQALVDIDNEGIPISSVYPHLKGFLDETIVGPSDEKACEPADIVFMATPDGVGMKLAPAEIEKGAKVVDFSGDFRFNDESSYSDYAGRLGMDGNHASADLLSNAVYGLPELHRDEINKETKVIGNPGCFAVSCILGLAPAVKNSLIDLESIICDCKTGVSGAGKKPAAAFHYPERYDNMNAYKLAGHQHVFEIERELGAVANESLNITFTAQIVPVCRGIMSTLYGKLSAKVSEKDVLDIYSSFYNESVFVRPSGSAEPSGTVHVRGTNCSNLVVSVDDRTGTLRIVSYIDNLMKGQAGSAVQNMNLLFDLPESAGFEFPGMCP